MSLQDELWKIINAAETFKVKSVFSYVTLHGLRLNIDEIRCENEKCKKRVSEDKRRLLERMAMFLSDDSVREKMRLANELLDEVKRAILSVVTRESERWVTYDVTARTTERLVIGTSSFFGRNAFEVGLSFHPVLDLPYIPSSSIKGALRSYVNLNELRCGELGEREIFGYPGEMRGLLLISDAFPVNFERLLIVPEVTTPTYREVEGRIEEHRAEPVPVIYPVVDKGVDFRFIVALGEDVGEECKRSIWSWIVDVMREGLGAKTLLGYGAMEVLRNEGGSYG
ncbi:MAG: hypothetical protein DRJ51_07915 [Thermoprotei archaeon]|nr:MAG: hypothetical protein DRJ51_07915 [Thermoprotei archaeon]